TPALLTRTWRTGFAAITPATRPLRLNHPLRGTVRRWRSKSRPCLQPKLLNDRSAGNLRDNREGRAKRKPLGTKGGLATKPPGQRPKTRARNPMTPSKQPKKLTTIVRARFRCDHRYWDAVRPFSRLWEIARSRCRSGRQRRHIRRHHIRRRLSLRLRVQGLRNPKFGRPRSERPSRRRQREHRSSRGSRPALPF